MNEQVKKVLEIKEKEGLQMLAVDEYRLTVEVARERVKISTFLEAIEDEDIRREFFALARGSQ